MNRPEFVDAWMQGYEHRVEEENAEKAAAAARPANVIDFATCRAAKIKGGRPALRTAVAGAR